MMAALAAPPSVLLILAHLVEEHAGLHYDAAEAPLLVERLVARAVERGFESLLDYYYFLRYDPEGSVELDALVETLVVQETYFFREADQLAAVVDVVLRPIVERGARPRVWCAAAATGEEPFTLAMMLAERSLLGKVDLVASDISARAIARARRGEFGRRSLRALPASAVGQYVDLRRDGAVVREPIRAAVQWERVNLFDARAVEALGEFDAILCRNVLIYFSDDNVRRVVDRLAAALRSGGCLLVGVSESLLRFGTSLRCEERQGTFFYQKVDG